MCFIENQGDKNKIVVHLFGLKISMRNHISFYFWRKVGLLLDIYFFFKRINLNKNYRIISLGNNCFPRVIATANKLKPRRAKGEKSCPFDLAFSDIDITTELINNNFDNFFEGLEKNNDGHWTNPNIKMRYVHDDTLSKEEFIKRYQTRIKNIYTYFSEENKHKFILVRFGTLITQEQIKHLQQVLEKYMDKNDFDIILINQSEEICNYSEERVHVINQNENVKLFDHINRYQNWPGAIIHKEEKEALKIYYEITNSMIGIIKKVMKNKIK